MVYYSLLKGFNTFSELRTLIEIFMRILSSLKHFQNIFFPKIFKLSELFHSLFSPNKQIHIFWPARRKKTNKLSLFISQNLLSLLTVTYLKVKKNKRLYKVSLKKRKLISNMISSFQSCLVVRQKKKKYFRRKEVHLRP